MSESTLKTPLDRSVPPLKETAKRFELAPFERTQLGQLEILCLPRREFPIVSVSLIATAGGADRQPLQRAGLAALTASCLTEGTSSMTAVEFQARAEQLGGFVSSGADWEASAVHAGSLSEHFEDTLTLVSGAYQDAAFRPQDIDRLLDRRASELARRAEDPASIAGATFIRELYGEKTLYGAPLLGTSDSLDDLTADEARDHWNQRPMNSALVVAGDVSPQQVERLAREHLAQLLGDPPVAHEEHPIEPATADRSGVKVIIVDRPKAAQTQLLMGHVGPSRLHEDRATLRLLNSVFGGKFSSRINLNLREQHGYTYGANSSFSARRGPGPFAVQSAVENEFVGAATQQVQLELDRIRTEPVAKDELEDTRSYLLGVQPYGFQSLEGWASALGTLAVFGFSSDWYREQQDALARVTAADVLRAAQAHFDPDNLLVVAVGPASQIASQFTAFEAVEVREPQAK